MWISSAIPTSFRTWKKLEAKEVAQKEVLTAARKYNNVVKEIRITLTAIKG